MRVSILFLLLVATTFAAVPPELTTALKAFRAEPPRGWSFTQTTVGEGRSTVERCDAAKPEFERWSLVEKDGRAPTARELATYAENRSRRSRGGTAPSIIDQLDLTSLERISDTAENATFRCALRTAEAGDKTAQFLRATLVLHKPSQTIDSIELGSTGEFSPTLAVTITEMKTTMSYSRPRGDVPALPQKVTTRVRGTAFWFKSLDADMTVTFSDYKRVGKR